MIQESGVPSWRGARDVLRLGQGKREAETQRQRQKSQRDKETHLYLYNKESDDGKYLAGEVVEMDDDWIKERILIIKNDVFIQYNTHVIKNLSLSKMMI